MLRKTRRGRHGSSGSARILIVVEVRGWSLAGGGSVVGRLADRSKVGMSVGILSAD